MQSLSPHYRPLPSLPSPLLLPLLPSSPSVQSSLSNGDKGRSADYLSNGKKRKADEKEFMTDYVRALFTTPLYFGGTDGKV